VVALPFQRLGLRCASRQEWLDAACGAPGTLLADHANCEKKAAATAMSLLSRFPEDGRLALSMLHLAQEELEHFERIYDLMRARGMSLAKDEPDDYVKRLLALCRNDAAHNTADRLLALSLVEARSCERFLLLAGAIQDPELQSLYAELALSEEGHANLFVAHAERYSDDALERLEWFRDQEGAIVASLPDFPRMHG
jgi:tRNA-(ms[2]io[6]A)-hydroxylase